jgi:hypothetical protein
MKKPALGGPGLDMSTWLVTLILKWIGAIFFVAAYYFVVIKGVKFLDGYFPNGRLKTFLFRERGASRPRTGTELK